MLWLDKYKPSEFVADSTAFSRMETGDKVGDLAMGLFGEYVDVTVKRDDELDLQAMIARTNELIAAGAENICEASFSLNGLYCAVDILHKSGGGYEIYEVKSSTSVKDVYITDATYQKYVVSNSGVNVARVYIVNINNEYVYDGTLDIKKLFKITDITDKVDELLPSVEGNLKGAAEVLSSDVEPNIWLNNGCRSPYPCGYFKYCSENAGVKSPSVFDLYSLGFDKKINYYRRGVVGFDKLKAYGCKLTPAQTRQVDCALGLSGDVIDKKAIRGFLDKLHYPLYFLDFETMQLAVPQFVGTRPYEQIPFLYSLHYVEREGGEVKHKEFLAEPGSYPEKAIAEKLAADIPSGACVLAYNKSFECGRLKELAAKFPYIADKLNEIKDSVIDLIEPFQGGMYYKKEMGGSFSIKSVLPALYPNDDRLDYHSLDGVHNGGEAMDIYPRIVDMPPDEQKKACANLRKYCELDTLAMVMLWQELKRVSE